MTTKKTRTRKPKTESKGTIDPEKDVVVFALRLTREERDRIHKAAGPAKASKFVRNLALAASDGNEEAVQKIAKAVKESAS